MPASTAFDPALEIEQGRTVVASGSSWRILILHLCVGVTAGALIALQLAVMRLFAIGSWAHFGSLVVSLAMLGFGLSSAALCVARPLVERHGVAIATAALFLLGPLMAGTNLLAQQLPFNAVFILSDPAQQWRLAANFVLYLLPFLAGASFLGTVFVQNSRRFSPLYFADLTGAGACGLIFILALSVVPPEDLIAVPLGLGIAGAALWLGVNGTRAKSLMLVIAIAISAVVQFALPPGLGITKLAISDYKGVAYARKLPDSHRLLHTLSPYGDLQVYESSYLHFAPGLSDNAAFSLPHLPKNAYLGLYLDGDGPVGVIRNLSTADTAYFAFLPMAYPYLIKSEPDVFVARFGGGISTALALHEGARSVSVAESNPAVLRAFTAEPKFAADTGNLLHNERVRVIGDEGRSFLVSAGAHYDVVDLSLANSAGLSNPGGFSVVEQFAYTREALLSYMRALKPGGVLAITVWNKEDPPKSTLKLYTTAIAAARDFDPAHVADAFFVVAGYLSTTTVLYKNGSFSPEDIRELRRHTAAMSFDEIYYPSIANDPHRLPELLDGYRAQIFGGNEPASGASETQQPEAAETLPATELARLIWHHLVRGDWPQVASSYVFDTDPLTDNRPYFAGFIRTKDLPRVLDRLEILQDEWGYLLLWVTLGIATLGAILLLALPLGFGWRTMTNDFPGRLRIILYFACLGAGYILIEVTLLSKFVVALSNYTVSSAIVITSMLVFSGLGSLLSQRISARVPLALPVLLSCIGSLLLAGAFGSDWVLDRIGVLPPSWRSFCCALLVAPPAFLMGFPMPLAMTVLARLGKGRLFVWAWGINGCASVIGAALVPILATSLGLNAVLAIAGGAYLVAIPATGGLFALSRTRS